MSKYEVNNMKKIKALEEAVEMMTREVRDRQVIVTLHTEYLTTAKTELSHLLMDLSIARSIDK